MKAVAIGLCLLIAFAGGVWTGAKVTGGLVAACAAVRGVQP